MTLTSKYSSTSKGATQYKQETLSAISLISISNIKQNIPFDASSYQESNHVLPFDAASYQESDEASHQESNHVLPFDAASYQESVEASHKESDEAYYQESDEAYYQESDEAYYQESDHMDSDCFTPSNDNYQQVVSGKKDLDFPEFLPIKNKRPFSEETKCLSTNEYLNAHNSRSISKLTSNNFYLKFSNSKDSENVEDSIEVPNDLYLPDLTSTNE